MREIGIRPGTASAMAIGEELARLASTVDLPDYEADARVLIPPCLHAWARWVPIASAWLYFSFNEESLLAMSVTRDLPLFLKPRTVH